jgi:hypothetical protein
MADLDKFRDVAQSYSEKFDFDPYYSTLIGLLEKYTDDVRLVLEIGAANGIVPEKWNTVRSLDLEYYSVEPVAEMVQVAREKASGLSINYHPFVGNLENALEACKLSKIDLLLTSRSLHEVYLAYGKNLQKVFSDLSRILVHSQAKIVVFGDAEKNTSLTPEETQRFIAAQVEQIGHGHDPATDYLDFATFSEFMTKSGYELIEQQRINQPLPDFEEPVWNYKIAIFNKL